MNALVTALSFAFGTLWGSFFYTLALRYSGGMFEESPLRALTSRSRCASCGKALRFRHLVPLLGYIALRGRCGHCGAAISPLYPMAELFWGALCAALAWRLGVSPLSFTLFLLLGIAAAISIIDVRSLTIPDSLVVAFLVLSLYPVIQQGDWKDALYGGIFMGVFFLAVLLAFPGSFGGGDLKFAAAIGVLAGLEQAILVLETALISGAVVGTVYALASGKSLRSKIPFAPFLSLGLLTAVMFGREILLIYHRIID